MINITVLGAIAVASEAVSPKVLAMLWSAAS